MFRKRTVSGTVALGLSLALAAPAWAQAEQTEASPVAAPHDDDEVATSAPADPEGAEEYWTEERLRDAEPMPMPVDEGQPAQDEDAEDPAADNEAANDGGDGAPGWLILLFSLGGVALLVLIFVLSRQKIRDVEEGPESWGKNNEGPDGDDPQGKGPRGKGQG